MSKFRRYISFLLALVLVVSNVPLPVFAAEAACPAHTSHDALCGYAEAVAGSSCTHVCSEACLTQAVTACVHDHGALGCTYVEAVEASYCGHTCGDGTCAYQAAVAAVDCTCTHTCPNDGCGYVPAAEAKPCTHSCEVCDSAEPEVTVKTVTAWSWVDPEGYLTNSELAIPGANETQVASRELILSMLPGTSSYEFIWNILSYAYPDLYEQEYKG